MEVLHLTPKVIEAYKELITDPQKHGLNITPITDFFKPSETVTAKHIRAEAYTDSIKKPLPKVVLYIIMDELYGMCKEKDAAGNLGYKLKFYADPFEIRYKENGCQFYGYRDGWLHDTYLYSLKIFEYEIIGNIHDNPD